MAKKAWTFSCCKWRSISFHEEENDRRDATQREKGRNRKVCVCDDVHSLLKPEHSQGI